MPDSLRPNFVFIVADQLRYDLLSCTGHPLVKTPHIDRLAENGVRFDRAYTVQPMCMATRSTWFTGRTPRGHGVRCNGIPLRRDIPTMPEALRNAGYCTCGIGKMHLNLWMPHADYELDSLNPADWPEAIPMWESGRVTEMPSPYYGLDKVEVMVGKMAGDYKNWLLEREPNARELLVPPAHFHSVEHSPDVSWKSNLPAELHYTSWAAERSGAFFEEMKDQDNPFFLWCSIPDPHPVYAVANPWFDMYRDAEVPEPVRREGELDSLPPHYRELFTKGLFTAGRIAKTDIDRECERDLTRVVCGMVSQWDAMVGKIVSNLEAAGLAENTVIAVMSDHGQMLGDHWLYNMPPTHLDGTARVPSIWYCPERFVQGKVSQGLVSHLDFAPTVLDLAGVPIPEGDVPPVPEAKNQRAPWPGKSFASLLTGKEENIQDSVIIENDADYLGMRQRSVVTADYHLTCYIGESYGELFDLKNDPQQLFNRWDDPGFREVKRDLQVLLMERFAETDSTLPRRLGHA